MKAGLFSVLTSFLVTALILCTFSPSATAAETVLCKLADGFDLPVGKPNAHGYYVARGYWPNGHLGEDWNGNGGGDTDRGDPIYCIGRGVVVQAYDVKMGWGPVVIVRHAYREKDGEIKVIDSLYGHLEVMSVKEGELVERGQKLGTMGKGPNGMYWAHLHFEIRKNLNIGMNRSKFAKDYSNYHSPRTFIKDHRDLQTNFRRYPIPVGTFQPYDRGSAQTGTLPSTKADTRFRIPLIGDGNQDPDAPKEEEDPFTGKLRDILKKNTDTTDPEELGGLWEKLKSRLNSDTSDGGKPNATGN